MKLIVGLGNPGRLYADSRHNIGFSVVKALSRIYKISFKKDSGISSLSAKVRICGQNAILSLPLTFMNLSGIAVAGLLKKYKIDLGNLLVVSDDLDLEFGRIKLRASGSSGGHRGLKSIIDSIGSQEFARLRIGIGRPSHDIDASDHVLSPFYKKEKEQFRQTIKMGVECCQAWVTKGITEAMNIFNQSASTALSSSTRSILKRAKSLDYRSGLFEG